MVTVEEMKEYLKVEHNEEDVMISGMIEAASSMVKTKINRPIAEEEMTDETRWTVPKEIPMAIKMLVAYMYENRGTGISKDIENAVNYMVKPHKHWS